MAGVRGVACVRWLAAAWLCWWAPPAHADARPLRTVVLLAPSLEEAPALRAQVLAGLHLAQASVVELEREGLDPVLAACRTSGCARDVAKRANVSFVLLARVTPDALGQP